MMNDLEICKAIAEIEFGEKSDDWWYSEGIVSYLTSDLVGFFKQAKEYNPLTDDALCFQLMIKYSIDLIHELKGPKYKHHRYVAKRELPNRVYEIVSTDLISPNKAICLVIIEANKGK